MKNFVSMRENDLNIENKNNTFLFNSYPWYENDSACPALTMT